MSRKVFFKLIVPNYNNIAYIKMCLDSIVQQTFQNFICVVVDDMSTDMSDKLVEYYERRYPGKVKLIKHTEKKYAGGARNTGLKYDKYEADYIWFIDSDDRLYGNDVLQKMHDKIEKSGNPDVLRVGSAWNFNSRLSNKRAYSDLKFIIENTWHAPWWSCISSKFSDITFQEGLPIYNDALWFAKLLDRIDQKKVVELEDQCYIYNRTTTTGCHNTLNDEVKKNAKKKLEAALVAYKSKTELSQMFIDKILEVKCEKKKKMEQQDNNQITIAMATYPGRKDSWKKVVDRLLPQCDRLCICFNGYDKLPDIPKSNKIIAIVANGKNGIKDLGCNNKMYWLGDFPGYYMTVDDDIEYPTNYVSQMLEKIKAYNDKVIVSLHGHIYINVDDGKIQFKNRRVFPFHVKRNKDVYCHRVGMGVAIMKPAVIKIKKDIFLTAEKNSGDDEITALWAQLNKVPLVCAAIKDIPKDKIQKDTYCLWLDKTSMNKRQAYLESYTNWKLYTMSNEEIFFRIIIPTYNLGTLIQRCVSSILSQTFTSYKIIIVDDCSTDNTRQILQQMTKKYFGKIIYKELSKKMYGGGARNVGLTYCTDSKYTLFIDGDDYYSNNNVLKTIYDNIQKNNFPDLIKLSYQQIKNKQNAGNNIMQNNFNEIIKLHSPPTSCIKTSLAPQFVADRIRFNDVVWSLRVYDKINTFSVVQTPCFQYTLDENKESCQHAKLDRKRIAAIYQLISDLMLETFKKPEIRNQQKLIISNKAKELQKNNFYITMLDI